MTTDPAYFAMKQFFGSYFHQDWVDDAANTHEVLADFLRGSRASSDQLEGLAAGIDRLIADHAEAELPALLDHLGSYYFANPPQTYASWLVEIAAEFRQAALEGDR